MIDEYTIHMCSTHTSNCTLYCTECIIIFGLGSILFEGGGGGLHTVQYKVYHYFLHGSILLEGGLKHPSPNDAQPLHPGVTCEEGFTF